MNMSLKADIICLDGHVGNMKEVFFNPKNKQITHFVIKNKFNKDYVIIPTDEVEYTSDSVITIDKKANYFKFYPSLYSTRPKTFDLNDSEYSDWGYDSTSTYSYKLSSNITSFVPEEELTKKMIPKGDIELKAGLPIKDIDGKKVGHIDEVLINNENEVTSIIIKTIHLLNVRDVEIKFKDIQEIKNSSIVLSLKGSIVEKLPSFEKDRAWD